MNGIAPERPVSDLLKESPSDGWVEVPRSTPDGQLNLLCCAVAFTRQRTNAIKRDKVAIHDVEEKRHGYNHMIFVVANHLLSQELVIIIIIRAVPIHR